ncbi:MULTISPECIES: Fe2+-dependent dioxygenase [unclassified Massilia]|uniref:Fe2+-dependent dioxygenase n=1 Tax=unclassified Massilia TaxID=2609279 RepID=UPI001B82339C|nr:MULTISPECIES: Fe2+-dependent dioxygenase [unclassified Massilia]MBQ5939221.1 Fe2+-dependent dioxygenase [Massilia sp. AB1]MBQ5965600.1 Fe2+-dependent dioxygenase [Massilia sp. ZL223]
MLLHIPNVLTQDELRGIRARLDRSDWQDGRATVGAQGGQVKRNRQLPEASPEARELSAIVQAALARNAMFFAAVLPVRSMPPLFNRYGVGEHYGNHVDGAVRVVPGASGMLRTDVSGTLFLSAPEEYEGGELVVQDTYGEHEVKLDAGDLIVYPSTSVHRVEPVTQGERICSFFWTQSMIRDDTRRSMLYELDRTIESLRARLGDCQETVALTAHYHNLLRQWAET